jgi:hypothetical protein
MAKFLALFALMPTLLFAQAVPYPGNAVTTDGGLVLLGGTFAASAVATTQTTLSGVPGGLQAGKIILLTGQTTTTQNGLWQIQTGAWNRPAQVPSGYTINQECPFVVVVASQNGANGGGQIWALSDYNSAITVDATAQTWALNPPYVPAFYSSSAYGGQGVLGRTTENQSGNTYGVLVDNTYNAPNAGDCAWFIDNVGTITDYGTPANYTNFGPCVISDANGHPWLTGNGTAPTVTGTGFSLVSGSQDNSGAITGTASGNVTLTFGSSFSKRVPFCSVAGYGAGVLPRVSTAPTATAVVFTTSAAGTFSYVCL